MGRPCPGAAGLTGRGPALAWCPFPDPESARHSINTVLDERLAACANILPGVESHFVWQGEREKAEEVGVLFKTDLALLEALSARVCALHPYDEPAFMGWACDHAAPATAAWLGALRA